MAEAAPRKPRNTLLSAYYGLQPPSEPEPPSASSASQTRSAIPSDREQALRHATHLTQTLPLSDLLQRCTELRHSSDALELSLHSSIRRYYEHLDATTAVARSCIAQVSALRPATHAIAECAQRAKRVNDSLAAARAQVDKLDGARRATLLKTAAHRLAAVLPPAYAELADLCTDPAAARDRLFLAAHRAAVVLPAVEELAPASPEFERAAVALRNAMETVRTEIASRGEADDPYGLAVADAIHLRRLLGDSREALIDAFCSIFTRQLCADGPSEAARAAAGPTAIAQAGLQVSFAADRIVPNAFKAGDKFADIFATEPGDNESWHTFVVWLSDVLDDAVAARTRHALQSGALGNVDEVRTYLSAVDRLVGASTAASGQRASGDPEASSQIAAAHVDEVIQALGAGLRGTVREAVAAHTAAAWQAAVNKVLSGESGPDAGDDLLRAVREGCSQGAEAREPDVTRSEKELLHEVARYATRDLGLEKGIAREARAGMLLRELGKRYRGKSGAELEKMGGLVFTRIREDILERAQGVLYGRLHAVRQLKPDSPDALPGGDVSDVVELLNEAGRVGEELGVETLRRSERQDELLGDDESIVSGVAKMWVEMVRQTSIASEAGVHALQLDANELGEGVGREEAFQEVERAALERCADRDAVLLPKEGIRIARQQRRSTRS